MYPYPSSPEQGAGRVSVPTSCRQPSSFPSFSPDTLVSRVSLGLSLFSVFLFQSLTHSHALIGPCLALPCSLSLVFVLYVHIAQSVPSLSLPVLSLISFNFSSLSVFSRFCHPLRFHICLFSLPFSHSESQHLSFCSSHQILFLFLLFSFFCTLFLASLLYVPPSLTVSLAPSLPSSPSPSFPILRFFHLSDPGCPGLSPMGLWEPGKVASEAWDGVA